MDVFEALHGRRSVRKLLSDEIPKEDFDEILEAGRISASWANTQCWEVVAVKSKELKEKLSELLSENNPARKAVKDAPVVLAACGRKGRAGFKKGEATTVLGDWLMFDVALFLSNVTHAAHAMGYGTVHVGLFDHEGAGALLKLPEDVQVVELMPIGRPAAPLKSPPPRREVSEFVHIDEFGER